MLLLKRLIDLICSCSGMILLVVPFTIIAGAIKLDSKGPVFFRQIRVGKDRKPFKIWKLRTMADAGK